jgi:hypothetical protein
VVVGDKVVGSGKVVLADQLVAYISKTLGG